MTLGELLAEFTMHTYVHIVNDKDVLYDGTNNLVPRELEHACDVVGAWVAEDTLIVDVD